MLGFEGYVNCIGRWFNSRKEKEGVPANMINIFLNQHKIFGTVVPFFNEHQGVYTDIRFTIAVEEGYFCRFADKLRGALLEVEREHGQLDSKL